MREGRPLRIAMLTHSVNPRGGVVHTLELAGALQALGHAVTVFAPATPGQRFFREPSCASELVAAPTAPAADTAAMVGGRIAAFVAHLSLRLEQQSFDVFHTHDGIGGNALAQLQVAGRIHGFVRTVHHLDTFADAQLMEWQRISFRQASQVFCVSALWCEHLRREHGIVAAQVANGVDASRFSPAPQPRDAELADRLGIRRGAPVILALGGVEERKNTLGLLRAFAQLRQQHSHAQLVIAGGVSLLDHADYGRAFRQEVQRLGLAEGLGAALRITGAIADDDIPALYRLADVVAMPSLREGFGLVTLEALASGVPVVASRIAPFTEYLREDDVAWADPHSADSIAQALSAALAQRGSAAIARSAARLVAEFSWTSSAARHAVLYRDGLAARPLAHDTTRELAPCP